MPTASLSGSETITHTYDDRGRLMQVSRSGAINDGIQSSYSHDPADNRTNVTVSGPGFSINDVATTEGAALAFTVTRTSSSTRASVNYGMSGGTAAAGSDYAPTSGTLGFAIGETSKPVIVSTIDDVSSENTETVILALSNPQGGAIIDGAGTGTINDNDVPLPCAGVSFAVSNASVTGGGPLNFIVSKAGTTSGSCSVDYATADGSAVAGREYTPVSGTLTFTSIQTSRTVTVNAGTEFLTRRMYLNLSAPTGGATISDGQGEGTIRYDDPCPRC